MFHTSSANTERISTDKISTSWAGFARDKVNFFHSGCVCAENNVEITGMFSLLLFWTSNSINKLIFT